MAFGVYAFGHGGGVPNRYGNTNFSLIPNLDPQFLTRDVWRGVPQEEVLGRDYWLLDCGPETAMRVCGAYPGCVPVTKHLKGVLVTHSHDDHSGGLKSLAYYLRFVEGRNDLQVFCPPGVHALVDLQLEELDYLNPTVPQDQRGVEFFFNLQCRTEAVEDDFHVAQLLATFFPVDHNIYNLKGVRFPSCGLNVTLPDGRQLLFSGDTAFPIPMKGAHWVVHDTQGYAEHDPNKGLQAYVHCPYSLLRDAYFALPESTRPELWITHTGANPPAQSVQDDVQVFIGGTLRVFV